MFGTNEIVGRKYFKEAPLNSLLVTSIFFTLQGEGPFAGRPAVFVRLAKCNLACSFCDTYFDKGEWMSFEQIAKKARAAVFETWGIPDEGQRVTEALVLVITGGEPLLQPNLAGFLYAQTGRWDEIQIETNGTQPLGALPFGVTLVVSPKCSEDAGVAQKYLRPSLDMMSRANALKFVVSENPESPYHTVPDWVDTWRENTGNEVYISPMNRYREGKPIQMIKQHEEEAATLEERTEGEVISFWTPGLLNRIDNQANHEYAARYALMNGFRLTLQMHLYAGLA